MSNLATSPKVVSLAVHSYRSTELVGKSGRLRDCTKWRVIAIDSLTTGQRGSVVNPEGRLTWFHPVKFASEAEAMKLVRRIVAADATINPKNWLPMGWGAIAADVQDRPDFKIVHRA